MLDKVFRELSNFNDQMKLTVEEMMDEVLHYTGNLSPDMEGGYFCLTVPEKSCRFSGRFSGPMLVGRPDEQEKETYFILSQEKADRLGVNHNLLGHLSSFQSRDPVKNKWGGSIIVRDEFNCPYILSFAGLTEHENEAVMLLVGISKGWLTEIEAIHIAKLSDNEVFLGIIRADKGEEAPTCGLSTGVEMADVLSGVLSKETCEQIAVMNHDKALNLVTNELMGLTPDPVEYIKWRGIRI